MAQTLASPILQVRAMDLDLDLTSVIGRKVRPVSAEVVRELTESDLALLETERGVQPSHIQRLSERHHALARCLASGLSVSDACAITGYTPSRISILQGDPSFQDLVSFYRSPKAELIQDLGTSIAAAGKDAVEIIRGRLEDAPDEVPLDSLIDIAKFGADRSGHGPQSRQQHLHVHVGLADRLKAARQRTEGPKMIEGSSAPTISPGGNDENS